MRRKVTIIAKAKDLPKKAAMYVGKRGTVIEELVFDGQVWSVVEFEEDEIAVYLSREITID